MPRSIPPAVEQRLFAADPLDVEGILRIDTSLGLDAFAESRTLLNARTLLAALDEQPSKATAELNADSTQVEHPFHAIANTVSTRCRTGRSEATRLSLPE